MRGKPLPTPGSARTTFEVRSFAEVEHVVEHRDAHVAVDLGQVVVHIAGQEKLRLFLVLFQLEVLSESQGEGWSSWLTWNDVGTISNEHSELSVGQLVFVDHLRIFLCFSDEFGGSSS